MLALKKHGDRLPMVSIMPSKQVQVASSTHQRISDSMFFFYELDKVYHVEISHEVHQNILKIITIIL